MILVALGSNQPGPWGSPRQTVQQALVALNGFPATVVCSSSLIITSPMGPKNQPDYVTAVVHIQTRLSPQSLLRFLNTIERSAGRKRRLRWGPRTLDLDILDYHGLVENGTRLTLPHPGIPARSFVLNPIAEIAPRWKHPVSHTTAREMLARLSNPQP